MREHWNKWGWLVPLVVAVVFFLRIILGRQAFCGPAEENCLREWISALGGWAAVVAAIPTILFLSRQVRDAQNQHRDNALINLWSRRVLAEAVVAGAPGYIATLQKRLDEWRDKPDPLDPLEITWQASTMEAVLRDAPLRRAELEIAVPDVSTVRLTERLEAFKQDIAKYGMFPIVDAPARIVAVDFRELLQHFIYYVESFERTSRKYLDDTAQMVKAASDKAVR